MAIHEAQIKLRRCVTLCGKGLPEVHRLDIITTLIRGEPIFEGPCCHACRASQDQQERKEDRPHHSPHLSPWPGAPGHSHIMTHTYRREWLLSPISWRKSTVRFSVNLFT